MRINAGTLTEFCSNYLNRSDPKYLQLRLKAPDSKKATHNEIKIKICDFIQRQNSAAVLSYKDSSTFEILILLDTEGIPTRQEKITALQQFIGTNQEIRLDSDITSAKNCIQNEKDAIEAIYTRALWVLDAFDTLIETIEPKEDKNE